MTSLHLKDLDVPRGGITVCRGVSVDVQPGQVTVLLGPNGAGKSTLLDGTSGVIPIRSGTVLLGQDDVTSWSRPKRARAGLAYVQQGRTIFATLTVEQNLLIAGGASSLGPSYELFPRLGERFSSLAGLLSGGEQQMLVVARALATKPGVLMLDELSLGLAPVIVKDLLATVRQLADSGIAVLLVEQFAALALTIADTAVVLQKGAVVFNGTAEELKHDRSILEAAYLAVETEPDESD